MSIKSCYVLAPPGAGGSHLVNLIKTSQEFSNHLPFAVQQVLYQNTVNGTAHYDDHITITSKESISDAAKMVVSNGKPVAFSQHLGGLLMLLDELNDPESFKIILIDMPLHPGSSHERVSDWTKAVGYLYGEQVLLYKKQVIERLAPGFAVLDLSIDEFHSENIALTVSRINDFLGINLDPMQCQTLHRHWRLFALAEIS